jgi:hypothetical protein
MAAFRSQCNELDDWSAHYRLAQLPFEPIQRRFKRTLLKRSLSFKEVLASMAPKMFLTAFASALLLLAVSPAHAFRCGSRIITRGDHADKILRFCGEPVSVQTRLSQRSYVSDFGRVFPGVVEEVVIEEWTYNLGPHQLIRVVRLENGFVADIKHLGYGY